MCHYSQASYMECAFSGNRARSGASVFGLMEGSIRQGGTATLICCDLYGNEGGDWVGYVEEQLGLDGSFSADPLFCDPDLGDLTLAGDSP